jgi:4-hydroxy-4-methyl-2-oxoglutarate aldolase
MCCSISARTASPDRLAQTQGVRPLFRIGPQPRAVPDEILSELAQAETATIGHFLVEPFMTPAIAALGGRRVAGTALTVSLPGDDGAALAHALSIARPGDILVVDRCHDCRHACWGAVTTRAAELAGIRGAVIDGFVTDMAAIKATGFPIWCRGASPVTTKLRGQAGAINVPVSCGGVVVRPGDAILADENGVMALAPDLALAAARRALAMQAAENDVLARLERGEKLGDINGASALVAERLQAGEAKSTEG